MTQDDYTRCDATALGRTFVRAGEVQADRADRHRDEPSKGRDEPAADSSRFVEVERRPLAEYPRIAGDAR